MRRHREEGKRISKLSTKAIKETAILFGQKLPDEQREELVIAVNQANKSGYGTQFAWIAEPSHNELTRSPECKNGTLINIRNKVSLDIAHSKKSVQNKQLVRLADELMGR